MSDKVICPVLQEYPWSRTSTCRHRPWKWERIRLLYQALQRGEGCMNRTILSPSCTIRFGFCHRPPSHFWVRLNLHLSSCLSSQEVMPLVLFQQVRAYPFLTKSAMLLCCLLWLPRTSFLECCFVLSPWSPRGDFFEHGVFEPSSGRISLHCSSEKNLPDNSWSVSVPSTLPGTSLSWSKQPFEGMHPSIFPNIWPFFLWRWSSEIISSGISKTPSPLSHRLSHQDSFPHGVRLHPHWRYQSGRVWEIPALHQAFSLFPFHSSREGGLLQAGTQIIDPRSPLRKSLMSRFKRRQRGQPVPLRSLFLQLVERVIREAVAHFLKI